MAAYTLWGRDYEFEDCGIGSCWINRNDRCCYSLRSIDGDDITFHRGDCVLITFPRSEAELVMSPT